MVTKTFSALMAVALLLSAPAFSMDEVLRGGNRRHHRFNDVGCVNGTVKPTATLTIAPSAAISLAFATTAGQGFNITTASTPNPLFATAKDLGALFKATGTINACSFASIWCFTFHVTFTCPFKCTPTVVLGTSGLDCGTLSCGFTPVSCTVPSTVMSPIPVVSCTPPPTLSANPVTLTGLATTLLSTTTQIPGQPAFLLSHFPTVSNVTNLGFDINWTGVFIGDSTSNQIPLFATNIINALDFNFIAENCDCCPKIRDHRGNLDFDDQE